MQWNDINRRSFRILCPLWQQGSNGWVMRVAWDTPFNLLLVLMAEKINNICCDDDSCVRFSFRPGGKVHRRYGHSSHNYSAIAIYLYIIWKIFGNVKMYIIHDKENKQSSYRCRRKQILSKYGNMSLLRSQIAKYCFIRTEATDVDKPQIVTNRASHSLVVGNIIGPRLRLNPWQWKRRRTIP